MNAHEHATKRSMPHSAWLVDLDVPDEHGDATVPVSVVTSVSNVNSDREFVVVASNRQQGRVATAAPAATREGTPNTTEAAAALKHAAPSIMRRNQVV